MVVTPRFDVRVIVCVRAVQVGDSHTCVQSRVVDGRDVPMIARRRVHQRGALP